jgi:glycine cleavage system regulatory protein
LQADTDTSDNADFRQEQEEISVNTFIVLTFIGDDRPGLIRSLSQTVAAHGGNWLGSRSARLAGKFAGILHASVPDNRADALIAELKEFAERGLSVVVERTTPAAARGRFRRLRLELIGNDRPGIVQDISHALAEREINVDELATECVSAPMSGEMLFKATADLRAPEGIAIDELRDRLENLADELMVDTQLADVGDSEE